VGEARVAHVGAEITEKGGRDQEFRAFKEPKQKVKKKTLGGQRSLRTANNLWLAPNQNQQRIPRTSKKKSVKHGERAEKALGV